eukprot:439477_1
MSHRVFCWCTWRSRSTALLRSMYQSQELKVLHEPFVITYLFGNNVQHKSERYTSAIIEAKEPELIKHFGVIKTYDQVTSDLMNPKNKRLWIKQPAFQIASNVVSDTLLKESINTFLIRSPEEQIKSLYNITCLNTGPTLIDKPQFYESEIGMKELFDLYDLCIHKFRTNESVIIDASDLVNNSKDILQKYCEMIAVPFSESMLDWNNNEFETDEEKPWDFVPDAWVHDMKQSTTFYKQSFSEKENIEYPEFIYEYIEKYNKYYDQLWAERLQI